MRSHQSLLQQPQAPQIQQTAEQTQINPPRPQSAKEQRANERQAARNTQEEQIEAALAKFSAIQDAETRKTLLARAEAKRQEDVAWSRSLDNKVTPILSVAGFAIAGLVTLLTNEKLLSGKPFTQALLFAVVLALLYAAVKCVLVISPTLKVTEPVARLFGLIKLFPPRHIAHGNADEWHGHLYFGHTSTYPTPAVFIEDAIAHFSDDTAVLRDTLTQGYNNARICADKCAEIALATRGILVALALALIAAVTFYLGR